MPLFDCLKRSRNSMSEKSSHPPATNTSSSITYTSTGNMNSPNGFGAPPPYTGVESSSSLNNSAAPPTQSTSDDDKFAFLSTFDTILLVDDSGSMYGSRWRETATALEHIVPIVTQYDSDGIDLYFLHRKNSDLGSERDGIAATGYRNISNAREVTQIFKKVTPGGITPTGTRLSHILKPYVARCEREIPTGREVKPINIIMITDGNPTDDVEGVVVHFAKRLDAINAPPSQVGIQFFQVGHDEACADALRDLDDGLSSISRGGVRDMVDTVTWDKSDRNGLGLTADTILKTVLGAVMKRLDRKKVNAVQR